MTAPFIVELEPVADSGRPAYLSPSSISTFQQCPLRYRYSRIERLPEPSTSAQVLGSMTHEVLEELMALVPDDRTLQTARTILLTQWDAKWRDEVRNLNLSDYDQHMLRWQVWKCVQNYFELENPSSVSLDGIECRLEARIADVPVLGILDRWHTAPDGSAVISDYKTGKVASKRYDGEKRQQLMVYVDLHETIYESHVSTAELIYLKNKGTRVAYEPTQESRDAMRSAVASVWADMTTACETGKWEAKKTRLCDWCAYKGTCPAWRKY